MAENHWMNQMRWVCLTRNRAINSRCIVLKLKHVVNQIFVFPMNLIMYAGTPSNTQSTPNEVHHFFKPARLEGRLTVTRGSRQCRNTVTRLTCVSSDARPALIREHSVLLFQIIVRHKPVTLYFDAKSSLERLIPSDCVSSLMSCSIVYRCILAIYNNIQCHGLM